MKSGRLSVCLVPALAAAALAVIAAPPEVLADLQFFSDLDMLQDSSFAPAAAGVSVSTAAPSAVAVSTFSAAFSTAAANIAVPSRGTHEKK